MRQIVFTDTAPQFTNDVAEGRTLCLRHATLVRERLGTPARGGAASETLALIIAVFDATPGRATLQVGQASRVVALPSAIFAAASRR